MPFDHKILDPPDGGFRGLDGHEQREAVAALGLILAARQPGGGRGQAVRIPGV